MRHPIEHVIKNDHQNTRRYAWMDLMISKKWKTINEISPKKNDDWNYYLQLLSKTTVITSTLFFSPHHRIESFRKKYRYRRHLHTNNFFNGREIKKYDQQKVSLLKITSNLHHPTLYIRLFAHAWIRYGLLPIMLLIVLFLAIGIPLIVRFRPKSNSE